MESSKMKRRARGTIAIIAVALTMASARADDFDRIEGPVLAGVPKSQFARAHDRLTMTELGNLPSVLGSPRVPVLIVVTDQGNLARLIAAPALRKSADPRGEPLPILILERFETFDAGPATTRAARGRDVLLFDGFHYDLDTGQVVPEGQGGDVRFLARADGGPTLLANAGAKIYTLSRNPLPEAPATPGRLSPGRTVVPADFAGRYRLFANGQWSGTLELKVEDGGAVTGRFRSDQTGTSYPVTGQVGPEPYRIHFAVAFPRSRQEFDGRLWTSGKGAMAGTVSLLNQDLGFFALREGGRAAPDDADAPEPQ
jgi:hypothetical protein